MTLSSEDYPGVPPGGLLDLERVMQDVFYTLARLTRKLARRLRNEDGEVDFPGLGLTARVSGSCREGHRLLLVSPSGPWWAMLMLHERAPDSWRLGLYCYHGEPPGDVMGWERNALACWSGEMQMASLDATLTPPSRAWSVGGHHYPLNLPVMRALIEANREWEWTYRNNNHGG